MNNEYPHIRIFQKAALATLLTLATIFATLLYFEIYTKKEHKEFMVLVDKQDFITPIKIQKEEQMQELDKTIDQLLNNEKQHQYSNIAVNKSDQVKDNETKTIQSEDDYEQKLIKDAIGDKDYDKFIKNKPTYTEKKIIEVPKNEKPQKVKKEVYTGPTNIIYYLKNRKMLYISAPTYQCQGAAKMVINIEVLSNGKVNKAELNRLSSSTTDPCYTKAALHAAKTAIYSKSNKRKQTGKIVFTFIAQ